MGANDISSRSGGNLDPGVRACVFVCLASSMARAQGAWKPSLYKQFALFENAYFVAAELP
jgi:hypothetical protein